MQEFQKEEPKNQGPRRALVKESEASDCLEKRRERSEEVDRKKCSSGSTMIEGRNRRPINCNPGPGEVPRVQY